MSVDLVDTEVGVRAVGEGYAARGARELFHDEGVLEVA